MKSDKEKIKDALKELKSSDKTKVTVELKGKKFSVKPFFIVWKNKLIIQAARKIIPCHFKNWLIRRTGVKMGHDVCLPNDLLFDPYFPELITVEDGALVGSPETISAHEFKDGKLTLGKILIKKRALVGGYAILKPGAVISENSILSLMSELDKEMPSGEVWLGSPAKMVSKLSQEEIDKYFKPSDGNYKKYYKEFRKGVDDLRKDPSKNFFKMHYNGKRLNAGNDWWKARNVLRIWYNGIIIEFCKFLGPSWFKNMLLRMTGAKIGKNVIIERWVTHDQIFPDSITLEDNVKLRKGVDIAGHEYTISQTVFGRVLIKKGAELKEHVLVRTGTTIGENSVIEPNSVCQKVIPANEIWEGIPAKFVRKI